LNFIIVQSTFDTSLYTFIDTQTNTGNSQMAAIKKAYQSLVTFLETNKDKKVNTILDDIKDMCSAKTGGGGGSNASTVLRDEEGNVTHIFCYYHKQWEPVSGESAVEYGKKLGSATGLNSMCKEGTSAWTKQQRQAKKAGEDLLTQVAAGEVAPADIAAHQADLEAARKLITPREDGIGFTAEAMADAGYQVAAEPEAAA
jgi:hypothetical protein